MVSSVKKALTKLSDYNSVKKLSAVLGKETELLNYCTDNGISRNNLIIEVISAIFKSSGDGREGQLAGENFISIGEGSNMHDILLNFCKRAGFSPDIKVVCNDIECYEKFIASGVGIAIGTERNHPDIAYLDVSDFNTRYNVYAYYKKESYSGNVKGFVDFLKES